MIQNLKVIALNAYAKNATIITKKAYLKQIIALIAHVEIAIKIQKTIPKTNTVKAAFALFVRMRRNYQINLLESLALAPNA